jgi:hypothetical protein
VYLDVDCSLCLEPENGLSDLDVETTAGPSEGDCVGRVIGLGVPTMLVANSSCVATLKPASMDETTSLGRAASSTERAFCEASAGCEADMAKECALDKVEIYTANVTSCPTAKRRFPGPVSIE